MRHKFFLQFKKYLWPRTLFGRLTLIWVLALLTGHVLNVAWYALAEIREERDSTAYYLSKDVSNLITILENTPKGQREIWVQRFQKKNYRYFLNSETSNVTKPSVKSTFAEKMQLAVQKEIGASYPVSLVTARSPDKDAALCVHLLDGASFNVEISPYREPASMMGGIIMAIQLLTLATFTWLAVRQATRPLFQLAQTADKLGTSMTVEVLPEDGPLEISRAAIAFNAMQRRIAEHLTERMHILAAISHDLKHRSPACDYAPT